MKEKLTVISLVAFCSIFFAQLAIAQAAQPQFLLTWSASNSYVPPGYSGKALPNQESQITASVQLISTQGSPIDLSGQTVYWYLDNNLLGGGVGVQHITFRPYGTAPNTLTLKVDIPNYPSGALVHEIEIPLVSPSVVIDAPYSQSQFTGIPLSVQAIPYFFNATSVAPLSFSWSVNGQAVSDAENPQTLQISLPAGTPSGFALDIALNVENSLDSAAASANTTLTYAPKP